MIIFILITIFAIYYIAMIASLFKSEGFSIIGLLLDIVIMGTLIFYYFVGARFVDNDLSNFLMFMDTGSYIFMYLAIKCLWVKPKVVNYLIAKELDESKEVIEEQELDLQTSKIRGIYFFIIAVVMLIITKLRMQPELQADAVSMNPVFIFIGVIIILIWLILDIYRKKKYGIFLFKTIVPLVVTTWIIIATIILS
ncbi:TPA: DUF5080 family protein [Staphylococcus argenteus]|uniref:Putative membrane protein n=5 Tax=Staphylococcus argenteus TaxID=985002 RepID=A0A7U7PX50_9STAP|nr:DUF5080 family protein [Staphylococcus argenteus]BBN30747.1 hypothetical protein KUH140087_1618 [Staphylococcus aureus]EKF1505239.1 DUF5080 family protein [Staphylococcus argenteus]EYG87389.1 hypothetical protein V676_02295 [Staphylococcus argenteus]EYL84842.1 hypothetical protein V694_02121 [Staphylococcus argenteus]KAA0800142.1 DUF5080 family protein [Staphylococcus argenteus]